MLFRSQLLKFLLKRMIFLKENYLDFVSLSNFNIEDIDSANDWYEIVSNNYKMSVKTLNKVYFDEIETIKHIKSKHIRKCYNNRNAFYHRVANAYRLYEKLFIENDLDTLKKLIETRLIKVANSNRLYEIYIFFNLFKGLKDVNYRVLHSNGNYSTSFIIDNIKVTIHYRPRWPPGRRARPRSPRARPVRRPRPAARGSRSRRCGPPAPAAGRAAPAAGRRGSPPGTAAPAVRR